MRFFLLYFIILQAYKRVEEIYRDNVFRCLINNQLGFIKLFLENKLVQLGTYLSKSDLRKLYKEVRVTFQNTDL